MFIAHQIMQIVILQVSRQAREVVGLLGAANGFRQVTSGQKGIAARRVVSQVLHSLSKLGDALGGVLPSRIYVQAAGQVLQAVLETVIGEAVTLSLQLPAWHRLYLPTFRPPATALVGGVLGHCR